MAVEKSIEDGTESRQVTLRIRETGIREILEALGPHGFASLGHGRIVRLDDSLFLEFCANVGRYDTRVLALGLSIDVPLTEDEQKTLPPEEKEEDEQEKISEPIAEAEPIVGAPVPDVPPVVVQGPEAVDTVPGAVPLHPA